MVERVGKKLKGLGEPDEAKIEEATATLMRVASVLDHHLQDREWLVSQVVTLADLSVASHFMYRDLAKFPFDRFAGINDWFARIEVLHCWRRTRPSIPGVL
jgi:glutathione S-transferase